MRENVFIVIAKVPMHLGHASRTLSTTYANPGYRGIRKKNVVGKSRKLVPDHRTCPNAPREHSVNLCDHLTERKKFRPRGRPGVGWSSWGGTPRCRGRTPMSIGICRVAESV